MMQPIHALLLSVIEGLTEFLPVSSTGHLILAARILGLPQSEFIKSFDIVIQSGAILAVVLLYARMLISDRRLLSLTLVSFLPSAVAGFLLYRLIKSYLLGNDMVVVVSLVAGGLLLCCIDTLIRIPVRRDLSRLRFTDAVLIGLFQTVSLIPGVSRSAATILGGMIAGLSRNDSVKFSFLLAIPTMLAATSYDLLKNYQLFSSSDLSLLTIGFLGSFLTALVSLRWLLTFVRNNSFLWFGIYRVFAGLVFAGLFYT